MVLWHSGLTVRVIQPSGNVADMRGPSGSLVFLIAQGIHWVFVAVSISGYLAGKFW